jgi:3-oxoacyl-[acyl-carrier-protein] synthase II
MVAGGAEELCPTQAAVFDAIMAASRKFNATPERSPRPFDRDRDGLVIGEGATTLVLESLERAQQRGAEIYGEIVGFATNADGAHLVRPQQATQETVMRTALKTARLAPSQIGYVSAHATATDRGDIIESVGTHNVLGRVPISAMKSYTGHTLGACGAFELWAAIMMMNEGWFAPTLNLENLDAECADLDYIRDECRDLDAEYIMSNNFAFGGVNTSIIASRWRG